MTATQLHIIAAFKNYNILSAVVSVTQSDSRVIYDCNSQLNENENGKKRASIGPIGICFGANSTGNVIENSAIGYGDENEDNVGSSQDSDDRKNDDIDASDDSNGYQE